jgi:hypothetical protein
MERFINKLFIFVFSTTILLLVYPLNAEDIKGSISFTNTGLDSDWDFIPVENTSFQRYEENERDLLIHVNKITLGYTMGARKLNAKRITYPKHIDTSINHTISTIGLKFSDTENIAISFKEQAIDDQFFDCYQRGSLVIGQCSDADLKISTTIEKYNQLDGAIILLKGKSSTKALHYLKEVTNNYIDSFGIGYKQQTVSSDWLTPLEEIRSTVILNSIIDGERVGDLITEILQDLPPRRDWHTHVFSIDIRKEYLKGNSKLYLANQLLYGLRSSFDGAKQHNKSFNNIFESGLIHQVGKFDISVFFRHYQRFHLWKDDLYYNGRSAKYFDEMFGEIGGKIKFSF